MASQPCSTSRRGLLKAGAAASLLGGMSSCALLPRKSGSSFEPYVGAVGLPDGRFAISAINASGEPLWQCPVETRCHSGCSAPDGRQLIFFERRPGWSFHVIDAHTGERRHHIKAAEGEHFVGHGVFSPDSHYLYATASRYQHGEGIIAVYDARQSFQRVDTFNLKGIGPHELTLHPDGETLIIGLGGILTHPDYDRIKLNLDTMEPALILMERRSGRTRGRFRPPHHKQSSRHVSVSSDGGVYVAYQYQGPLHETPPLLARLHQGRLQEFGFDTQTRQSLANYIASVVAHPENNLVAATSPVGGTAIVFHGLTGELLARAPITDCAGAHALAGGDFMISSGQGRLVRLGADNNPRDIAQLPVAWDHHLV